MAAPQALAWAEIQAWAQLMNVHLRPWQAAVLRHLDDLWRTAWVAGQEKTEPTNKGKR